MKNIAPSPIQPHGSSQIIALKLNPAIIPETIVRIRLTENVTIAPVEKVFPESEE